MSLQASYGLCKSPPLLTYWEEHSEKRLVGPVQGRWGWAKMIEISKSQT